MIEKLSASQTSAPAERNKAPILAALQGLLPATGRALEIAAGTGQPLPVEAQAALFGNGAG